MGQFPDKHQIVLPAVISQSLCAGADIQIVPIVCELLRINAINLWQALALILPVNSLSLLQHIGFQYPHLGNSSTVCLKVALMCALCLRAGKLDEEHGGRRWFRGSKGMKRKWVWNVHEGEIALCWRTAASQLVGVSTEHPNSCGAGSGAAIFAEQAEDIFFSNSKGSASGEFAGVFLACNKKIHFYD